MFRFRLTTASLVIVFCAAWFATSQLNEYLGDEIRKLLWLFVLAPSIAAVVYYRGQHQAFWLGFLLVLLLRALPDAWVYTPEFESTVSLVQRNITDIPMAQFLNGTVRLVSTIAVAAVCGLMFAWVYKCASDESQ